MALVGNATYWYKCRSAPDCINICLQVLGNDVEWLIIGTNCKHSKKYDHHLALSHSTNNRVHFVHNDESCRTSGWQRRFAEGNWNREEILRRPRRVYEFVKKSVATWSSSIDHEHFRLKPMAKDVIQRLWYPMERNSERLWSIISKSRWCYKRVLDYYFGKTVDLIANFLLPDHPRATMVSRSVLNELSKQILFRLIKNISLLFGWLELITVLNFQKKINR